MSLIIFKLVNKMKSVTLLAFFIWILCIVDARVVRSRHCSEDFDVDLSQLVARLDANGADSNFEDFVYCHYRKLNLFNANGHINFESMKNAFRRLHGDYLDEAIGYCSYIKQGDIPKKNAYKAIKCLYEYINV